MVAGSGTCSSSKSTSSLSGDAMGDVGQLFPGLFGPLVPISCDIYSKRKLFQNRILQKNIVGNFEISFKSRTMSPNRRVCPFSLFFFFHGVHLHETAGLQKHTSKWRLQGAWSGKADLLTTSTGSKSGSHTAKRELKYANSMLKSPFTFSWKILILNIIWS